MEAILLTSWGWQFTPLLTGFYYIPGGCLAFLPSTVWITFGANEKASEKKNKRMANDNPPELGVTGWPWQFQNRCHLQIQFSIDNCLAKWDGWNGTLLRWDDLFLTKGLCIPCAAPIMDAWKVANLHNKSYIHIHTCYVTFLPQKCIRKRVAPRS